MPKPAKRPTPKARRATLALEADRCKIDFVVLADFAQSVQGKLTLVGAGWNRHHTSQYPSVLPFGLGIGILVPWSETNRKHPMKFTIMKSEGPQLMGGQAEFEVGRAIGTPAGMTQRAVLGLAGQLQLLEPGTYEILVSIEGDEKRVTFEALPVAPPTQR